MNKILYILAFGLLSTSLFAGTTLFKNSDHKLSKPIDIETRQGVIPNKSDKIEKANSFQGITYNGQLVGGIQGTFHWLGNRGFWGTPIGFEPSLGPNGAYWLPTNIARYDITNEFPNRIMVGAYKSYDGGLNWRFDSLYNHDTQEGTAYLNSPSGVPVNGDASQDTSFHDFYQLAGILGDQPNQGALITVGLAFGETRQTLNQNFVIPANNTAVFPGQTFNANELMIATSNQPDNTGAYMISLLDDIDTESENNQFGYAGFYGLTAYGQENFIGNSIPEPFQFERFYYETNQNGDKTGMLYHIPSIDTDNEGGIYVTMNAIPIEDTDDYSDPFTPLVWKSTDNGDTWSEANKVPKDLFYQWVATKNVDGVTCDIFFNNSLQEARSGFVVYGPDTYSVVIDVYPALSVDSEGNENQVDQRYIVECRYENGAWSLHEVAEINRGEDTSPTASMTVVAGWREDIEADIRTRFGVADSLLVLGSFNLRGREIEASKTADGQSLVVKYLDFRTESDTSTSGHISSLYATDPYPFYSWGQNEQGQDQSSQTILDTIRANDIFMAKRTIGSDTWESHNVTNDDRNYILTFMPGIVANTEDVQIVYSGGDEKSEIVESGQTFEPLSSLDRFPQQYLDLYLNPWTFDLHIGKFSVDPTPYVMSVEDNLELPASIEINNIAPNPASDMFELTFTTQKAGQVNIALYDAMGNRVMDLFNNWTNANTQGKTFNIANLATGTYYVTMTIGTESVTKMLNVVR